MQQHGRPFRGAAVLVGLTLGLALGIACAGKGKGSRNPEECMKSCESERCAYDANALGNDEYIECLEACQDSCS